MWLGCPNVLLQFSSTHRAILLCHSVNSYCLALNHWFMAAFQHVLINKMSYRCEHHVWIFLDSCDILSNFVFIMFLPLRVDNVSSLIWFRMPMLWGTAFSRLPSTIYFIHSFNGTMRASDYLSFVCHSPFSVVWHTHEYTFTGNDRFSPVNTSPLYSMIRSATP